MKCEIEKKIKESEGEKINYIKRELEKKGLKVKIVKKEEVEESEKEEAEESEKKEWKISEYLRENLLGSLRSKKVEGVERVERVERIENPKEISNPYEKFKKYLEKEILRKEKSKAIDRLKGGMKKIEGGMKEKEIIIRIEVEI